MAGNALIDGSLYFQMWIQLQRRPETIRNSKIPHFLRKCNYYTFLMGFPYFPKAMISQDFFELNLNKNFVN